MDNARGASTSSNDLNPSGNQSSSQNWKQGRRGSKDGGKATQRSKQKRVAKMKDYNRKGVGKEGSDMDAFVGSATEETPPPSAAAALTPALTPVPTPVPVAAVVTSTQVLPPVPRVPEAESPVSVEVPAGPVITDSQEPKEGEEQQQPDVDAEEEKLVTALNEENTKVSAAALKEDTPPVIENIPVVPALFNVKLPYKDDQWSPVNPDGKKKYERDFLMELQNDPQSKKKPDNLPDLEVVLNNSSNRQPRAMDTRPLMNQNRTHESLTPNFALRGSGGTRYQGPIPKRNSQQGKPKSNKPNVIHVSLSLREDIKLHETENAWKPGRMKGNAVSEVEAKTEELYKKVRSVLNKLTPQKFHTLVNQVQSLPIDNSERLLGVINLVFEKAVDEPSFSVAYAQMCKVLSNMQVPNERKTKEDSEFVEFRKLLVNRCQHEFEKSTEAELNRDEKLKQIEATTDPEKKKELQALYDEEERKIRMKSVGNIRFIGELFKLQMLTANIMIRCIKHLLSEGDEESLECLCKLLTTIGKDLETKQSLAQYFDKMRELSMKRGEISSRVRFMLQDVLELRNCKWKPRRDDSAPKTIDQIQKEAEKETSDMLIALNSAQQTPRRQDDRGGGGGGGGNSMDRRKNRGGPGGGNMNEDGWNTVAPGNRSNSRIADADQANNTLGSRTLFSSWGKGAAIKTEPEKKGPQYSSANYYSALSNANEMPEERRQPPSSISSSRAGPGKSTPTPSIEKERMVASFKPAMEDSRSTQTSGHPSRSSSRDNSVRRSDESFRPSASISVDNDSVMNARPTILAPVIPPPITAEQLERKTHLLLDEFLQNANLQEAEQTVVETFTDSNFHAFILECINYVMERTSHARLSLGKLLCHLISNGIVKKEYYIEGLKSFLSFADDYAIDVPKVWLYVAETIVPLMSTEVITFTDFRKIVEDIKPINFIIRLFPLLIKDKGPNWIKDRWDAANLNWTDFMELDQVSSFVKDYHFEFTLGAPTYPQSYQVVTTALSMTEVEDKILEFLLSSNSFDQIVSWISANVGDKVAEPQFIRALSTAIVRSAIYKQNTSWKLKIESLRKEENLLTKYMDGKENLELQCLFAIQALTNELEHPQGFLCQIFQTLWDDSIIASESFLAWSKCNDGHEVTGKAVALKSLTSFFTALKETEDDSSCDDS
uniref:Uncharacterized protein n=3 Tax=Timema TaxID=61471 RepID=A0A7R9IHS2_9NEOP|nr:unnamed protein product [Timema tahoe]